MDTRLFIALTSESLYGRADILRRLAGLPVGMKVGLELFVKEGPVLLDRVRESGFALFLDLKFHDIPHTVAGAVRSACAFGPELVNVHASGGAEMMRAAVDALEGDTRILAVTLLTSLGVEDIAAVGWDGDPSGIVRRMALSAMEAGVHGVVCSPLEAGAVREAAGAGFLVVTPGIRPAAASRDDQKRTSTPFEAIRAGATALVAGRPVTEADDPRDAALSMLSEINLALDGN